MTDAPQVRLRVLIADDDLVTRRILQVSVQRLGHDCVLAEDGTKAWEVYTTQPVDVVISDWTMPGIDGLELCRRVRQLGTSAYTYFMLLTANEHKQYFLAGMEAGADDYLRKPPDPDELKVRMITAARITALHQQLSKQNTELERLNSALFDQGRTDPLTGIGNRLRMQEELTQLWSRASRHAEHRFCIALCDVDHFKRYNDTSGHQAGDEVLATIARTLVSSTRGGDAVYRYGGEEFLVMLPEPTVVSAVAAMNRLREAVKQLAIPHPGLLPTATVTISVGVAAYAAGKTLDQVIHESDIALYVAKRTRDCVASFDEIPALEAQALAHAKR